MNYHNPMEEKRRAPFRPTTTPRDFIDLERRREARKRDNAWGQHPSTERTGRPSSYQPPTLRFDQSVSWRQTTSGIANSSKKPTEAWILNNDPLSRRVDSFWVFDSERVYDKQGRRHHHVFGLFSAFEMGLRRWAQKPQLVRAETASVSAVEWNQFVELMVTSKLPRELQDLLDRPVTRQPESPIDQWRFGSEYEFQAFTPERDGRCINDSDKDSVLVVHNTLCLLLETVHWRARLGSKEMERCFGSDRHSSRKALAAAEEKIGSHTEHQLMREKAFSHRVSQRIQYMDRFSAWAQVEGFRPAGQPFSNPEPDLDVDAFLFRTGILEQQYMRTKRQFHHRRDILCQMYGLGMHEILFVVNNPNKHERREQLETMALYHKLVCQLGFHNVDDITTQFAYLSYACRNLVKREFDSILQRDPLPQLKEARRCEFKITTILVKKVWNTIISKNVPRPLRTFPYQSRRLDRRNNIADWYKLTLSERRALFHNDIAAARRFVPEAFIQLNAAAPAFVPAPTPTNIAQEAQTNPLQSTQPSIPPPEEVDEAEEVEKVEKYEDMEWDEDVENCWDSRQFLYDQVFFTAPAPKPVELPIPRFVIEHLGLLVPIRQPLRPSQVKAPIWIKREEKPIRQSIARSPWNGLWRRPTMQPMKQPSTLSPCDILPTWLLEELECFEDSEGPDSSSNWSKSEQPSSRAPTPAPRFATINWQGGAQSREQPEIVCPKPIRAATWGRIVPTLQKAVEETEITQETTALENFRKPWPAW